MDTLLDMLGWTRGEFLRNLILIVIGAFLLSRGYYFFKKLQGSSRAKEDIKKAKSARERKY